MLVIGTVSKSVIILLELCTFQFRKHKSSCTVFKVSSPINRAHAPESTLACDGPDGERYEWKNDWCSMLFWVLALPLGPSGTIIIVAIITKGICTLIVMCAYGAASITRILSWGRAIADGETLLRRQSRRTITQDSWLSFMRSITTTRQLVAIGETKRR